MSDGRMRGGRGDLWGAGGDVARGADVFAVFVLALVYFTAGCTSHLELIDEGQLVYPSWRVAQGAVPFRDFMHLYGPSAFLLNGALLRWFGSDLLVIRLSLVALKAITAVIVFLSAGRVASRSFAWLVSGLFVAVWGFPWAFNSPYPNHYALGLVLAGMLLFLYLPRHFLLACFVAGLLFGAAATFKQTTGVFAAVWFALFLLVERPPAPEGPRWQTAGGATLALASRTLRWLVIAGALLVVLGYQVERATLANILLLSVPMLASIVLLGARELRAEVPTWQHVRSAYGVLCCAAGVAVPLLSYGIVFARLGLFPELIFNVWNVPLLIDWFIPFLLPKTRVLVCLATVLFPFVAVRLWSKGTDRPSLRWAAVAVAISFFVSASAVWRGVVMPEGPLAFFLSGAWYGDAFRVVFYLPLGVVLFALPSVFRRLQDEEEAEVPRARALSLFYFAGAGSLLFFHPGGDFWHVIMAFPVFLPLLAYELERFRRATRFASSGARFASASVVAAFCLVLAAPFVHGTVRALATRPPSDMRLSRATGVVGFPPHFPEVVRLISYLRQRPDPRGLLVLTDEQMLYFLAGEPSVVEKSEFVLYLVGAGVIRKEDARALVPEEEFLQRLRETRPVIVDAVDSRPSTRLRKVFPAVARYIDANYRLEESIGSYRVLAARDSKSKAESVP